MNAINKALTDIKYTIPNEILNIAFMERSTRINQIISLDERILSMVLRPRVLVDCNLVGGMVVKLDTNKCNIVYLDNREYIIEVPKLLTNNKSIVSVLSLLSNVSTVNSTNVSISPLETAASTMFDNLSTVNVIQTSRLELVGENTILVADPSMHLSNGIIRCVIENSSNLENFNPRSYLAFSKLVMLAIKSFVYNSCKIKLDQGYVYGGHELGTITEIVDSYADAEEMYQDYLRTVFKKISFINQDERMGSYIKSMLGNSI